MTRHIIYAVLCLLMGFGILFYRQCIKEQIKRKEEKAIQTFFQQKFDFDQESSLKKEETSSQYIAILEIPKIHLQKGLFSIDDSRNHIDFNIKILEESDMPNIKNGHLLLAGHSGIGDHAYFNQLNKLQIGDVIFIHYQGIQYQYTIQTIYEIEKTGILNLKEEYNNTITIITCKMNTNKQLVVNASLSSKKAY